ncbi:MAG: NifB/NifX family molybdenum-iron cluster-binding protein [bacterium]
MKVAAPQMGESIAPCFEAATTFGIAVVEGESIVSSQTISCEGSEGYRRVRLLRVHDVGVLVCNGIKAHYSDILTASGMQVISGITGPISQVFDDYLAGRLPVDIRHANDAHEPMAFHHNDLVGWARELFTNHGYQIQDGPGRDAFLVDLVAEMTCPVCRKPVRVAICCGAHTYRSTVEITEFHHTTAADYNARVYVCPAGAATIQCCRSYGIQVIDPEVVKSEPESSGLAPIPLLENPIRGHEKVSQP